METVARRTHEDPELQIITYKLNHAIELNRPWVERKQGSIILCNNFLNYLKDVVVAEGDANTLLRQLYAKKIQLNAQCSRRWRTRQLIDSMMEVEFITLFVLDILKSRPDYQQELQHVEIKFDWRELMQELSGQPVYITQLGVEQWLRSYQ